MRISHTTVRRARDLLSLNARRTRYRLCLYRFRNLMSLKQMASEVQVRISQTTVATAAHLAVALVKERPPGDPGVGWRRVGDPGDGPGRRETDPGDEPGRWETGPGDGPASGRERRALDGPKDAALLFILEDEECKVRDPATAASLQSELQHKAEAFHAFAPSTCRFRVLKSLPAFISHKELIK